MSEADIVPDHEPQSLPAIRVRIRYRRGWKSLLRKLTLRELVLGVRFVDRHRGKGGVTRYTVTLAALRRHVPDLLPVDLRGDAGGNSPAPPKSELQRVRGYLDLLDERVEEVTTSIIERRVRPELEQLRRDIRKATLSRARPS